MRWLLLSFAFLLAACGGAGNPLAETDWRLVALGKADSPDAAVGNADMQFSASSISGSTGCNAYGGEYRVRGSELHLTDLMWQEAGCPSQALSQQEQRLQDLLTATERFEVTEGRLTLHSEGGQVLVLERVGK